MKSSSAENEAPPKVETARPPLRELTTSSPDARLQGRYPIPAIVALAAVYFLVARLTLGLATVGQSITLVWPSTGTSLAALLLFGLRLWPGVALGALAVNALTPGVPFLSACGMGIGNTLEAVLGVLLLRRAGFNPTLDRVRDVVLLLALAAGLSTTVSATFGCVSLWLGGVIAGGEVGVAWWDWWVGDLMGDIIVAPLLLTVLGRVRLPSSPVRWKEALALCATLFLVSLIAFGSLHPISGWRLDPYVVFPVLIWAALRFHLLGAVAANLTIASISITETMNGKGPFAGGTLNENLLQLQSFMGVAALTALVLGAVAAERWRAIRVRDRFLSMASHELKTPLTPMKLQVQLLRRSLDGPMQQEELVQKIRARLSVLERQIGRVTKLVDQLLDVSRVEFGQLSLTLEEVELGGLVRQAVETFGEELAAAKCNVEIRTEGRVVGLCDPLRLHQVLSNLLSNAMKYAAGGPVRISVESDGEEARICVADGGMGIPRNQREVIFQAFERGSYAPGVAGLGLGLHIARKIVEAHRGSIEVHSKLGEGSTFIVRLPLRPAA